MALVTSEPAHIEIVVLHADSPETIRRTHARYFMSISEMARRLHA